MRYFQVLTRIAAAVRTVPVCSGEYLKIYTYSPFQSSESHFQPPYKRLMPMCVSSAKMFPIHTFWGRWEGRRILSNSDKLAKSFFESVVLLPHCLHTIFSKFILNFKELQSLFLQVRLHSLSVKLWCLLCHMDINLLKPLGIYFRILGSFKLHVYMLLSMQYLHSRTSQFNIACPLGD